MKKIIICLLIVMSGTFSLAQEGNLTLRECQEKGQSQSPLNQQLLYQASISQLKLLSLDRARLPSLELSGQASYQSDVFSLPFQIPGEEVPVIPKDQYRIALGIQQVIYSGGMLKAYQEAENAGLEVERQTVMVELYKIRETINRLYFGTLLLQENVKLLNTTSGELERQMKIMRARISNGVLMVGSDELMEREILKVEQMKIEAEYKQKALLAMLSAWTGEPIGEGTELQFPEGMAPGTDLPKLSRPEQRLFTLQLNQLEAQKKTIGSPFKPKISAFANLGLGSPNPFNFFDTKLSPYYQIGLQAKWGIWDWGYSHRQREMLGLSQKILETRKENFEKTLDASLAGDAASLEQFGKLIEKDEKILALYESIVKRSLAQFENGVITSTDYIGQLNAQTQAKLNLQMHQLQLLEAEVNYLTKSGVL